MARASIAKVCNCWTIRIFHFQTPWLRFPLGQGTKVRALPRAHFFYNVKFIGTFFETMICANMGIALEV
jgi:hypothetical protein